MKPFVLVLLVAASALAAPSVLVNQVSENEVPRSNSVIERAFDMSFDGGDTNINILTLQQVLKDLAQSDSRSRALAYGQTLGVLAELATGTPGDACSAAALIDAYAAAVRTGNFGGFRSVLYNYIRQLASNLKLIVKLASNPNSVRYAVGPSGKCQGGGRTYPFEAAWDAILSSSSSSLIHEQYCTAKRLYYAFNSRSNNVGAAVTALSLPPVVQVLTSARDATSNLLKAVGNGYDASAAAASAGKALLQAVDRVQL